jgi:hypothetical protein
MLLALLLIAGAPLAWGNAGKKKHPADANASPGASPSVSGTAAASPTPPKLNIPIPVKHDAEGVKLPYFDIRGRLQMYFIIAKAIRVDQDHLEMKNAYMQTYDDKGAPDANVFMTRSMLDLNTRIVTSDIPVTVRRSDFEIIGQKMVFNTQTRSGHMTGHVRMIIYNRQEIARPTPSPSPALGAARASSTTPHPSATP